MYQYTTTNVINSLHATDYEGNTLVDGVGADIHKFTSTAAGLNVVKVGNFKTANIVSIHKRPYLAGVKEIAKLTVVTATLGETLRLEVVMRLSQSNQSEYVNYSLDFFKPIVVEIISSGNSTTDATAFKTQLNLLKDRFGSTYFTTTSSTQYLTFTAKDTYQRFKSIIETKVVDSALSLSQVTLTTVATGTIDTPGIVGFGDDNWMHRHVMLPSAENVRFFGISKDERPIPGGNYSEYALRYTVAKDGNDGIMSGAVSTTTHIFWVLSTIVDDFEAAIITTTKPIISVSADQAFTMETVWDGSPSARILVSGIIPFITSAAEISVSEVDSNVALFVGGITVNVPTGPPYVQTTTIPFDYVGAGTTTPEVAIDRVVKTIELTFADFAIDYGANAGTLSLGGVKTDTITKVGNAGVVTYAITTGPTKASVHVTTGLVTGLIAGDAVVTATDAAGNTDTLAYTVTA